MLLPIDELIQLIKLVLVCWGGKLKPTPKRVKVRLGLTQGGDARCCGSGWGQERAWREAVVGRKMLHLSLPWFIAVMSVTFLCQKVGAEKTGRHHFLQFQSTWFNCTGKENTLYTTAAAKKMWGMTNEEEERGLILGGQRSKSGLAYRQEPECEWFLCSSIIRRIWLHLPVLLPLFPPSMEGFTPLGYSYILQLTLPSSQSCTPIVTIKWHLCFVFTAPDHPELTCPCQGFFCHLMLVLSRTLATNDRTIPFGNNKLLDLTDQKFCHHKWM